jgi:RNA-binding protein
VIELSPAQRRDLRAKAHPLHPVVSIGQHGLTPRVMHEIDVALKAHGLIKVRVFSDDRAQRETMLAHIADELDAAPVQHLGKLLIVWRPLEDKPVKPAERPATKAKDRGVRGSMRTAKDRAHREPHEPANAGRRARGSASPQAVRTEPDSPRRSRATTSKGHAKNGGDAQAPDGRRRRNAGRTAESAPGKRSARDAVIGASGDKKAGASRRRSPPEADQPPKGRSAPNPRRRRRSG